MECTNHKIIQQWRAMVPFHLNLWLDTRISTVSLAVKKPWLEEGDTPFMVIIKPRKVDRPFLWLRGTVVLENQKKHLQLVVNGEVNGEVASSYVTDCMKAYDMSVEDLFRILVQQGFDQYCFADPSDGRDWIFKLRKYLLNSNRLVYLDPDKTPLEICSPWWNEVAVGQFKHDPESQEACWNHKKARERFEALKRCLSEVGTS